MKHLYLPTNKFYVGAKCPNCGREFNLLSQTVNFVKIVQNGEEKKILCCGRCKVNVDELVGKLNTLPFKEIKEEQNEIYG